MPLHWQLVTLCVALSAGYLGESDAISVRRTDANSDITVYLNGQPLPANGLIRLPAFQQLKGVVLPDGTRVPPSVMVTGGQLKPVNPPYTGANMILSVSRLSNFASTTTPSPSTTPISLQNFTLIPIYIAKPSE